MMLCGYAVMWSGIFFILSLRDVVSSLRDVVSSLCDVVFSASLCDTKL